MLAELHYLNHWLQSQDPFFMRNHSIDSTYFIVLEDVVEWIEKYRDEMGGSLPTIITVENQFEDFSSLKELDSIEYVVSVLKEQRAYMDYRPVLVDNSKIVNSGKTLEAMNEMRNTLDTLLKKFTNKMTRYDWIKNAEDRFEMYMKKHGTDGIAGLTTGLKELDKLTSGWKDDDLILIAGRTNEGKSLVGLYFAYHVWVSLKEANINDPVIYISTEMPEQEVAYRLDTLHGHFSNRELNEGRLKKSQEFKNYTKNLMKKNPSFLIMTQDSNGGRKFTPNDIRAIIENEKPVFIVIDQLYDMSDGIGETDIRKRIINISNQLRETNLSTKTPIMLIAQAGRTSAEDAKKDAKASPELHQIQESDNPAQKATKVITIRKVDTTFKLSLKKNRGGVRDKDVYVRSDIDNGVWEETPIEELVF
ncbi:DnaB-like helicase C-terminal domain-containing protein [Cytobacillus sp. Hm23]